MAAEYEKLYVLGSGTFGKAWLSNIKTSRKKCVLKEIKVIDMTRKEIDQAITEVTILARCRHENIIRYIGAFVHEGSLFIAMEYADGGDLSKRIEGQHGVAFSEDVILYWFVQITTALSYIHSHNILHRDIKPQNIFLTSSDTIKLGDFGIARVLQDKSDFAMTVIGTPYYLSPEICQKQPYNYKSDIWALGCILYEMCCLRVPFKAIDFTSQVITILSGSFEPIPRSYGPLVEDLVSVLLRTNADSRPTTDQILSIPAIQPYVLQYTQNLQRLIFRRKYQPDKNNVEKRADCGHNIPDIKLTRCSEDNEINNNNTKEENKNLVLVDRNQNIIGNAQEVVDGKNDDNCLDTPNAGENTPLNKTPENCCEAATCYCVKNPKKQRLMTVSPHMKDIVKKQRAAFSCEPGMKLNVGIQDSGPAPVANLFRIPNKLQQPSESDDPSKSRETKPVSMAQELMARKNVKHPMSRSKSMSVVSESYSSSQSTSFNVSVSSADGRKWVVPENSTPIARRKSNAYSSGPPMNCNYRRAGTPFPITGKAATSSVSNISSSSDEVFTPPNSNLSSNLPSRGSKSAAIDSKTFRVPLDKPRLSVPDIDRREECMIYEENNRVLFQAYLSLPTNKGQALQCIKTYLQEKIGLETYHKICDDIIDAKIKEVDYDTLKLKMKKHVVYLPVFLEALFLEQGLNVVDN